MEHRAELHDNRINFMGLSEPKQLNYLNIDDQLVEITSAATNQLTGTSFLFELSSKVVIEKRIVYDLFHLFGDVGGLFDFFVLLIGSIFSYSSQTLLQSALA